MSGIQSMGEALKAQQQLINIQASNLYRSQIPGSQEIRGTLSGTDVINLGNGNFAPGGGVSVSATTADFSQGQLNRTGFTTDLAISGEGFFTLIKNNSNELLYTRRGDFHFDNEGFLVNNQGLYVASFDHKTNALEKTSLKVNPVTDALGEDVLNYLEANGSKSAADIATDLGQPLAAINAKLGELKGSGYATESLVAGVPYFQSNLGKVGDQVEFTRDGFIVNTTRGLKRGNQIALAKFPNVQGLVPDQFGGEIYKATDAAVPGGIPQFGGPGDASLGFGNLESQALEQSTASQISSTASMGLLQRNFTSTAAAMKVFLQAMDDLINTFR